ncbi:hypothetical protein Celaphus_00015143, partial [Cervus elaphus hippelaphus]
LQVTIKGKVPYFIHYSAWNGVQKADSSSTWISICRSKENFKEPVSRGMQMPRCIQGAAPGKKPSAMQQINNEVKTKTNQLTRHLELEVVAAPLRHLSFVPREVLGLDSKEQSPPACGYQSANKKNFKEPVSRSMQRGTCMRGAAPGKRPGAMQQRSTEMKMKKKKLGTPLELEMASAPRRSRVDPTVENEETVMSRIAVKVTIPDQHKRWR